MYSDAVLDELWRIKDAQSAKYGGDVRAMVNALREQQAKEGNPSVSFVCRKPVSALRPEQ